MLILFCTSLLLGASLFYSFHLSIDVIGIISIFYGALFCFVFCNRRSILLAVALAASVILGALRIWMIPEHQITLGKQAFIGKVKSVDERLDKTLLVVRKEESDINIQVTLREKQEILPGDKISVRGNIELPEDFLTETGRTFDYDHYLESRGIEAVVGFGQVVKIDTGKLSFVRIATSIRSFIASSLSSSINFPVDGIVSGMLVGFQGGIPKYLSDIFRKTGTLHTLVLSGYNITVLAGFLGLILRRLPFRIKNIFIGVGIATLVLISGAGVAALRAGIMGVLSLWASSSLSSYNVLRALFISGLFFFFVSPLTIFVDPGFHLSFLATLFIITLLPILDKKLSFIPKNKLNLREILILAIGLPIFMLPYMMYFSGLFPLVSPLANIFLIPVIPTLMFLGLLVVLFSFIPVISNFFGIIASFVGLIAIKVLNFFAGFSVWQTPALSGWWVTFAYCILFLVVFRKDISNYFGHLRSIFQRQTN